MPTKQDVVNTARKYIDMPFRSQGRGIPGVRSAAIDCGGLLVCVAEDLHLIDKLGVPFLRSDYTERGPQPIRDELKFECNLRLIVKNKKDMAPGDVVTLRAPNAISHCGIVSDLVQGHSKFGLIYCYPIRGIMRVVETRLDERWNSRITDIFSWPGVE
jgi:hypothetical protein